MLGTAYLAHAKGLTVLTHNVTNPPVDYAMLFQSLQQNKPFSEAVLELMRTRPSSSATEPFRVVRGQ
jgi:hypothetical protein